MRLRGRSFPALATIGVAITCASSPAVADDGTPAAKAAVASTSRDARSRDPAVRARAAATLGPVDHRVAAKELLSRLRGEPEPSVQRALVDALATQRASREEVAKRLATWLAGEAESLRKREARGDAGFPLDPRTGEPALDSSEGRAALDRAGASGIARAGAVRIVAASKTAASAHVAEWVPFLQDPSDELVAEVLGALGRSRHVPALPAILDLFRMYPTAASWETGAVVDLAGDDASAKKTWMVRFGHPEKQRARPLVFDAMQGALRAITGEGFETPSALAAWMAKASDPKEKKVK